jgi:cysteine-rich repeat protein
MNHDYLNSNTLRASLLALVSTVGIVGCNGDDAGGGSETDTETSTSDTTTGSTTSTTSTTSTGSTTGVTTSAGSESDSDSTTDPSTTDSTGPICEPGSVNCVCDRGACDGDLVCEGGICVPEGPAVCGDGVVQGGEECDDGEENGDGQACRADCTLQACGDGDLGPGEECDDGEGNGDAEACTSACTIAACGDGAVYAGVEECDDGDQNGDTMACTSACVLASCGDGLVYEGVEECDDADMNADEAACTSACLAAVCGDGLLYKGVEECEDGNTEPGDGCSATCEEELDLKPNLLLCGFSDRDVSAFIPDGVTLNLISSCTPDGDTQAMLVSRDGAGSFDPAGLKAWIEGGGRVLTEVFASDEVYNAVFNAGVSENGFTGACLDTAPTVHQFTQNDPFWAANNFQMIDFNDSGCGNNVQSYPGLIPLAGWSPNEVSIGYRNAGSGRVWVTEFDWQDQDTIGDAYAYTEKLMGSMIVTPL